MRMVKAIDRIKSEFPEVTIGVADRVLHIYSEKALSDARKMAIRSAGRPYSIEFSVTGKVRPAASKVG